MGLDKEDSDNLARIVELLEEEVELSRERNQLIGEQLRAGDDARTRQISQPIATPNAASAPAPSVEYVDAPALGRAIDSAVPLPVEVFWPKSKAPKGWARVSVKHPDLESLTKRVVAGCLCGRAIVLKTANGAEFFSCEGVSKGGCDYRPAVYSDRMAFLTNLPPATKA